MKSSPNSSNAPNSSNSSNPSNSSNSPSSSKSSHSPNSPNSPNSQGLARIAAGVLVLLAGIETLLALQHQRRRITPRSWSRVSALVEPTQSPILAHRSWLEPALRARIEAAALPSTFAASSRSSWKEFWTIGHRSDPESLQDPKRFPSPPQLQDTHYIGNLVARRWSVHAAKRPLFSLEHAAKLGEMLQAQLGQRRCSVQATGPLLIQCPDHSRLRFGLAEIDYKPRRCLMLHPNSPGRIRLSMQLPIRAKAVSLQLWAGFANFNARLRSDPALQITVRWNGQPLLDRPVTDAQGWVRWRVEPQGPVLNPTLELELLPSASFSALQRPFVPCVDLQVLEVSP